MNDPCGQIVNHSTFLKEVATRGGRGNGNSPTPPTAPPATPKP